MNKEQFMMYLYEMYLYENIEEMYIREDEAEMFESLV